VTPNELGVQPRRLGGVGCNARLDTGSNDDLDAVEAERRIDDPVQKCVTDSVPKQLELLLEVRDIARVTTLQLGA